MPKNMNDTNGSIEGTLSSLQVEGIAKERANFDHIHSRSAKLFAMKAIDLEDTFKGKPVPQTILDSHMSFASSSIICSVAALEAIKEGSGLSIVFWS